MSLTIPEWEKVINELSKEKAKELKKSIDFIFSIPEIKKHFGWTNLECLSIIAKNYIQKND